MVRLGEEFQFCLTIPPTASVNFFTVTCRVGRIRTRVMRVCAEIVMIYVRQKMFFQHTSVHETSEYSMTQEALNHWKVDVAAELATLQECYLSDRSGLNPRPDAPIDEFIKQVKNCESPLLFKALLSDLYFQIQKQQKRNKQKHYNPSAASPITSRYRSRFERIQSRSWCRNQ